MSIIEANSKAHIFIDETHHKSDHKLQVSHLVFWKEAYSRSRGRMLQDIHK